MGLFSPWSMGAKMMGKKMTQKVAGKAATKAAGAMAKRGINKKFSDFATDKIAGMGGGAWNSEGMTPMANQLASGLDLVKRPTTQVPLTAGQSAGGAGTFSGGAGGGFNAGPSFQGGTIGSPAASGTGVGGYLDSGGSRAGAMSMDWMQQAFGQLNNQVGLSQQLGGIEDMAQGRIDQLAHQGGARGSALSPAFNQAIMRDADKQKAMATAADKDKRFAQGLQLSQLVSGAVTNPLLDIMGIEQGAADSAANRQLQKDMEPEAWEKVLGGVASIVCWVAREVIPERWQAARAYMFFEAPTSLFASYVLDGERLAQNLTPADRVELRPVFEEMADRGAKYLEV